MIYRVLMNEQDIYNPQERQYALIDPHLTMELNTAGSFEFTMHPSHGFYDDVKPFTSLIEVFEDETLLWFGRPIEIVTDFYNQKKVYCEGALAFFNDSVQRLREYRTISVHTFFRTVIANHNAQVDSYKQFTVGTITVEDKTVYRKLNYDSTFDCLKRQCLNAEGGYFFIRRENGVNYIDWLAEMPYTTNQPVEFGLNMLSASTQFDMSEFCTIVLPLGEEVDGARLTVASVNGGSDIIESEAISDYGRIVKCVEFNGVVKPETLYEDGIEYLQSKQFDNMTIECSAAEMHWQNENYILFRLGQRVHAHSVPHIIDKTFDLLKLEISLDTAQKQITLGTYRRPSLTEITQDTSSSIDEFHSTIEDIGSQLDDIGSTVDDLTDVPSPEDIIEDIHGTLDDIDDLLGDDDFQSHIQDMLDDGELDDWLIDHGVPEDELEDVVPEVVIELIGDDLDDITSGLDDMTDYDDLSGLNDDLADYWGENQDIFDTGSGSSSYDDISHGISGTGGSISSATNPSSSMSELNAKVIELAKQLETIQKSDTELQTWKLEIEKRLNDVEELCDAIAIDAWIHEIDGERPPVGTVTRVNFVTTV